MRVVVAAWIGSTNLGDELIARSIFGKLHDRGCYVTAISVDPQSTQDLHGVNTVSHVDPLGLIRELRRADRLLFGGGGLLQDESSFWNVPYQVSRLWLARLLRVPSGLVGVGATGLSGRMSRTLVGHGISPAVAVSARDRPSAEALRDLGVPEPIVASDAALAVPVPTTRPQDRLVICLRPSLAERGVLPVGLRRAGGMVTPQWVTQMAEALDETCRALGLQPHFVAFQRDRDHALHRAVAERMTEGASAVVPELDSVIEEVATARVVVAMRYHAGIASLLAGRPSTLISYSSKMRALAADVGPGVTLLENSPALFGQLPHKVERALGHASDAVDAREKLRHRERGNDTAIDMLLEP